MVDVVQLVRASDCGSECRGFESHLPPKINPVNRKICRDSCFLYLIPSSTVRKVLYFCNSNGGVDVASCSAAGEDDSHGYSPLFRTLRDAPGNIEHDAALGKLHDERRPSRGEKRQ